MGLYLREEEFQKQMIFIKIGFSDMVLCLQGWNLSVEILVEIFKHRS